MKRLLGSLVAGAVLAAMVGCGSSSDEPASTGRMDPRLVAPSIGRPTAPGVEVTPMASVAYVEDFGDLGGRLGANCIMGGEGDFGFGEQIYQTCITITHDTAPAHVGSDPNTNTLWQATGLSLGIGDWRTEYLAGYEPTQVIGEMPGAVTRAGAKWQVPVGSSRQLGLLTSYPGWATPRPDGANTMIWCTFEKASPSDPDYVAAIFLWHNAEGVVSGYDILLNRGFDWEVNTAIAPGGTQVGTYLDVQAAVTANLGYLLGLQNLGLSESNATLSGFLGTGELNKQTLTPGEVNGVGQVLGGM